MKKWFGYLYLVEEAVWIPVFGWRSGLDTCIWSKKWFGYLYLVEEVVGIPVFGRRSGLDTCILMKNSVGYLHLDEKWFGYLYLDEEVVLIPVFGWRNGLGTFIWMKNWSGYLYLDEEVVWKWFGWQTALNLSQAMRTIRKVEQQKLKQKISNIRTPPCPLKYSKSDFKLS